MYDEVFNICMDFRLFFKHQTNLNLINQLCFFVILLVYIRSYLNEFCFFYTCVFFISSVIFHLTIGILNLSICRFHLWYVWLAIFWRKYIILVCFPKLPVSYIFSTETWMNTYKILPLIFHSLIKNMSKNLFN